jgi:hypothetical protein
LSNETDFVLGFIPFYLERLNGIFILEKECSFFHRSCRPAIRYNLDQTSVILRHEESVA